jgi:hypothetical protein
MYMYVYTYTYIYCQTKIIYIKSYLQSIAPVNEMCDGFDHAVLLVIRDASHQSEVQDHQAAIGGSKHISRTTGQHR